MRNDAHSILARLHVQKAVFLKGWLILDKSRPSKQVTLFICGPMNLGFSLISQPV